MAKGEMCHQHERLDPYMCGSVTKQHNLVPAKGRIVTSLKVLKFVYVRRPAEMCNCHHSFFERHSAARHISKRSHSNVNTVWFSSM